MGINPRLIEAQCGICGKIVCDGIALLGSVNSKHTCRQCGMVHVGRPPEDRCQKCGRYDLASEALGEHEKLPGGLTTCEECKKTLEECEKGGAVLLVETQPGNQHSRTGRMWGVKREACVNIFGESLVGTHVVMLVDEEAARKIGLPQE